jgi:hypothetical protein
MQNNILNIQDFVKGTLLEKNSDFYRTERIINLLGPADTIADLGGNSFIYKYSNWEFTYEDNILVLICVYNKKSFIDKNEEIFFNNSIGNFYLFLKESSLEWSVNNDIITIKNGCQVLIDLNKIGKICLLIA